MPYISEFIFKISTPQDL